MKESKQKVFLALWPDNLLRKKIDDIAKSLDADGKPVPIKNLHITLVFLGYVNEATLLCIKNFVKTVKVNPFELKIDKTGNFKQKIFWLGCKQIPDELIQLQQVLEVGLQKHCGYRPESRLYIPHITLIRKLTKPISIELTRPIIWPVNSVSLVQSEQGESSPIYFELSSWDLVKS